MSVWEILLIGVALSMDAFAVGMTNGMAEPKMRALKMTLIALTYAFFQFLMPVLGYYCGAAFASLVKKIAPWLAFFLLAVIGGKMIADFFIDYFKAKKAAKSAAGEPMREEPAEAPVEALTEVGARAQKRLGAGKLLLQAVATSIDALAVGVTFLAAEVSEGLPFHVVFCALAIGAVTFCLSFAAVFLGKRIGNRFSSGAGLLGGLILLAIGLKILIESFV